MRWASDKEKAAADAEENTTESVDQEHTQEHEQMNNNPSDDTSEYSALDKYAKNEVNDQLERALFGDFDEPEEEEDVDELYPYTEHDFGKTLVAPSYRVDLRFPTYDRIDQFISPYSISDWSHLAWRRVGKPLEIRSHSSLKKAWEMRYGAMSVKTSWEFYNKSIHEWFMKDIPNSITSEQQNFWRNFGRVHLIMDAKESLGELIRLGFWNYAHRSEDVMWDPKGKRALFKGLGVKKPRILVLGAADGYDAMQLYSLYPGGEVVLVDYDEFCMTKRFGEFPESYPFLGFDTGNVFSKVWYKDQMQLEYMVEDINNLPFEKEFDIVMSSGLINHFPDDKKPEAFEWHRRFVKTDGLIIMTTPRNTFRTRFFLRVMTEIMGYPYQEVMSLPQLGLYAYENGFDISYSGYTKFHNGIIARPQ